MPGALHSCMLQPECLRGGRQAALQAAGVQLPEVGLFKHQRAATSARLRGDKHSTWASSQSC